MANIILLLLLVLILCLPFFVKQIEKEIEYFLFVAGLVSMTVSGLWSSHVVAEAALEPVKISAAVLTAGMLFEFLHKKIRNSVIHTAQTIGNELFVFFMVVVVGLLSSAITAIIAALLVAEIVSHLKLSRKIEIKIVVMSCFSIGLGASLTPIGEPLSTIVVSKLRGAPYDADFVFLFKLLWIYIIPSILVLGVIAAFMVRGQKSSSAGLKEEQKEDVRSVIIRAFKVYVFVAGLILLGTGFKPLVEQYIIKLPHYLIYWINIVSAVLDNATLAAAEISPAMSIIQIKSAVLGLIISGGMLIPGNIPNIICANKLSIKSVEWAKTALPAGFIMMALFFVIIMVFPQY